MADENTNEDEGAKPEEEEDGLGDAGKRALEAERKARRKAEAALKAAKDALAATKADQDSSKSDVEKLTAKVDEMVKRAEAAERKALVAEVAQEKGLPPKLAARLSGSTREELEADADDLLEVVGTKDGAGAKPDPEKKDDDAGATPADGGPFGGKPKEDLKAGATPEGDEAPDPKKLADSILDSGTW